MFPVCLVHEGSASTPKCNPHAARKLLPLLSFTPVHGSDILETAPAGQTLVAFVVLQSCPCGSRIIALAASIVAGATPVTGKPALTCTEAVCISLLSCCLSAIALMSCMQLRAALSWLDCRRHVAHN